MYASQHIIDQTKRWINDVVVGCNFCPFAANVIKQQRVHFQVHLSRETVGCLNALSREITRLDNDENIETIFLIFPDAYQIFDDYLDLIAQAERMLKQKGYAGIYQLASFHPLYQFANSADDDAANYTNRSVYPMIHLLRESSIDKALEKYDNPENIPARNIHYAREKGLSYMMLLRNACV